MFQHYAIDAVAAASEAPPKMKKFLTKQQWRITVPNLRQSPKDEERSSKRSSGFYDFQEAQQEYDRTRSLPNSVYIDTSGSDTDEPFEDAKDMDVYTDIESKSENIDRNNSRFEYDVPRISFKFFEKHKEAEVSGEETTRDVAEDEEEEDHPHYEPVKVVRRDVEIVLVKPQDEDQPPTVCHPSERFVSQTEIFVRSLESLPRSFGSDPNLHTRDDPDENLYKIPRSLKATHRLSQSLEDFDLDKIEQLHQITPQPSSLSIEHISASQVIVQEIPKPDEKPRFKKPNILKNPKVRWNSFRSKFSNMMLEQASQQRVGAFSDKEKITINLEEVYKNSKTKCKKVLQNTGKMFQRKRSQEGEPRFARKNLKASDIEYKLNYSDRSDDAKDVEMNESNGSDKMNDSSKKSNSDSKVSDDSKWSLDELKKDEFDFVAIKNALKKKILRIEVRREKRDHVLITEELVNGQNGFEDLRRYAKQGGDFCKELSAILQERAEAEAQYAKSLSKLSAKLMRACRDGVGGLNEAWKAVAIELETRAEGHRLLGMALSEETAKPLRNLTESQHRIRKQSESSVDKATRLLADWRTTEAKGKKHSHSCARENEKLQDAAVLDNTKFGKQTLSKSTSLIQLAHIHTKQNSSDKDNAKLEGKKRKAEDAVKKADVEYYSLCVRAERARLEWESAVQRGTNTFQALEEERLNNLKLVLTSYLHHTTDLGPRLIEASERLKGPILQAEPSKDMSTFQSLKQSSQQVSEQLLPDFYCEHITLAMNRERRKQALIKLLHLVRDDIEREKKSRHGLENLSKAIKQTPSFGSEDSQQTVTEKLYHINSMLTYLEAAKYKVQNALSELDSRPRSGHRLAPYVTVTRDKSGLQQSVLKVPQWLREEWSNSERSPVSEKSTKSDQSDSSDPHINDVEDHDWLDRGAADGNSNQPDSDFDEFSSQCSSSQADQSHPDEHPVQPVATCRAIYAYTPNMNDELPLRPGDVLSVYRQQDDGWWLGEHDGNVGIFPATYVEVIKD